MRHKTAAGHSDVSFACPMLLPCAPPAPHASACRRRHRQRPCRRCDSASPSPPAATEYEAVIGLETHVQLNTRTKAFCGCPNAYGAAPNEHTCPVCLGLPGALPVLNREAVRKATLLGMALNCRISTTSSFDRKHYFYADLPKGYQTSQYDVPVAEDGWLEARLPEEEGGGSVRVRVSRAHLEEDSGKLVHAGSDSLAGSTHSLADYNRAGTPLVEVVTAPDMRTGKEAAAYAAELQRVVRFLDVSDGNMAEGSLRCDVNVSVRPVGSSVLGTKVEVKNLNSFSAIARAVDWEIHRQVGLITSGKGHEVVQETRTWEEGAQRTSSMRKKEGLADYRYFPEPDLLPVSVTPAALQDTLRSMPELPAQLRGRYEKLGLPAKDVLLLADSTDVASYFDAACTASAEPRGAANWIMGDLTAFAKQEKLGSLGQLKLTPGHLAELLALVSDGTISGKIAKDLLPDLLAGGGSPKALVQQRGLVQISDTSAIEALVDAVLAANPGQVAEFRAGKDKLKGFFVGAVMKQSGGKANPPLVEKLLMPKLRGDAT